MLVSYCILQIYMKCLCANRVCTSQKTQCLPLQVSPSEHAEIHMTSPLPCLSALHTAFPSCLCCWELPKQDPSLTQLMWFKHDPERTGMCPLNAQAIAWLIKSFLQQTPAPHWFYSFLQKLCSVLDCAHTPSVLPKVLTSLATDTYFSLITKLAVGH